MVRFATQGEANDRDIAHEISNSPAPMWIFELVSLCILEVNEAATRQYGYSRKEFLALTPLDLRPAEEIRPFLHSVVQHGGVESHPALWRHRTKNGLVFPVSITSQHVLYRGREAHLVRAVPLKVSCNEEIQ